MRGVIDAEELARCLGEVTVLDVRWQLGRDDGEQQFLAGHVPGACFVPLAEDLSDAPSRPVDDRGRHPLPRAERFAGAMRRCGVSSGRRAVVMDGGAGAAAARCWWLLRHHGHDDVLLLDGGWARWQALGLRTEQGPAVAVPGDFVAAPGRLAVLDHDEAERVALTGVLEDVRAPERYRGEHEPVDAVAGHVPGGRNVPASANLGGDGTFRAEAELRALHAEAIAAAEAGRPVAASCGSGVTAALDVLVLHALGVQAGLHAGSWSGWSADLGRPVATGG